jgi:hypothetical protein
VRENIAPENPLAGLRLPERFDRALQCALDGHAPTRENCVHLFGLSSTFMQVAAIRAAANDISRRPWAVPVLAALCRAKHLNRMHQPRRKAPSGLMRGLQGVLIPWLPR